ncbi:MAG: hypothetical protein KL787_10280 [Taibaiella sp.]|nr:hypothetical protein [Taibaiella sp.]
MSRKSIIYILLVSVLIVLLVMFDSSLPRKVNWSERYDPNGTWPYDTRIITEQLLQSPRFSSKEEIRETFYEWTKDRDLSQMEGYLYVHIGHYLQMDSLSYAKLVEFVASGNDALISAYDIADLLKDTLKKYYDYSEFSDSDSFIVGMYGTKQEWLLAEKGFAVFIAPDDSSRYFKIGYARAKSGDTEYPNFIRIPLGKGYVYLHTAPVMFSNHYLLNRESASYANHILSQPGKEKLLLQGYSKSMRRNYGLGAENAIDNSPLQFIFNNIQLKYAWYLALASIILFIIFNAKRKQRVVPVVKPLENTTVAFTQTISNLFYELRDHHFIIQKRIIYFLEHVRTRYLLDTSRLDDGFIRSLSLKSGASADVCTRLVQYIRQLQKNPFASELELKILDQLIARFQQEEQQSFISK